MPNLDFSREIAMIQKAKQSQSEELQAIVRKHVQEHTPESDTPYRYKNEQDSST